MTSPFPHILPVISFLAQIYELCFMFICRSIGILKLKDCNYYILFI